MKPCVTVGSSSPWARRDLERFRSGAVITSPYLTSPAAEAVIGCADPETTVVLTTFDATTFAAGGSSLGTVRKLMARGYRLRALDGLHAKLVVTEGAVLVGSQNLTAAGTRNLEATARVSDPAEVARVREGVAPSDALADAIKGFVRLQLSAHEYPREVAFVEALPMTTTGKVMRGVLREGG